MWLVMVWAGCAGPGSDTDEAPDRPDDTGLHVAESLPLDTSPPEPTPFEPSPPTWSDCGEGTECADVAVLADPDDPFGPTLTVHLRRLQSDAPTRTLWLVDGGPGDAGTRLIPDIAFFQGLQPGLTIISADHRGAGASTPLACPTTQGAAPSVADEDWQACSDEVVASGTELGWYTAEAAARDLQTLIPLVAETPTIVWGISYGTHVVQRLLPVAPPQVEGALLDGLVPPSWTFADFDASMDEVGRDYLARCDADPFCRSRLGGDAVAFVESALQGPPCGTWGPTELRLALGALLLLGDDREAIPATAFRHVRCTPADEAALLHLEGTFPAEDFQNELLLVNIGTNELWPASGPTGSEALEALDDLIMATGAGAWLAQRNEVWPDLPTVALDLTDASTVEVPVLLMHGGLDPTVPLSGVQDLLDAYPNGQSIVSEPSGHVVLNFSSCGVGAYLRFLSDPTVDLADDLCATDAFTDGFDLPEVDAMRLFGTSSAWQ